MHPSGVTWRIPVEIAGTCTGSPTARPTTKDVRQHSVAPHIILSAYYPPRQKYIPYIHSGGRHFRGRHPQLPYPWQDPHCIRKSATPPRSRIIHSAIWVRPLLPFPQSCPCEGSPLRLPRTLSDMHPRCVRGITEVRASHGHALTTLSVRSRHALTSDKVQAGKVGEKR